MNTDTSKRKKRTFPTEKSGEAKEVLGFQLEVLRTGIDLANQAISRIDEITHTAKNWLSLFGEVVLLWRLVKVT